MHNVPIDKEPMYDDWTLELIETQQVEELITALIKYCVRLEKQVVNLRCRVNRLTPKNQPKPYPELHSNIYQVFYGYEAYSKFEHLFKPYDL